METWESPRRSASHQIDAASSDQDQDADSFAELCRRIDDLLWHLNGDKDAWSLLVAEAFEEGKKNILHYCAERNNSSVLECITRFIQSNPLNIDVRDQEGMTALGLAIQSGKLENVNTLLSVGASVHIRDGHGGQPLHIAMLSNISRRAEICRCLVDAGADLTIAMMTPDGREGYTALHFWMNRTPKL